MSVPTRIIRATIAEWIMSDKTALEIELLNFRCSKGTIVNAGFVNPAIEVNGNAAMGVVSKLDWCCAKARRGLGFELVVKLSVEILFPVLPIPSDNGLRPFLERDVFTPGQILWSGHRDPR